MNLKEMAVHPYITAAINIILLLDLLFNFLESK